jgi:hypothetical protein
MRNLAERSKDPYNFVLYVPEITHHLFRITGTGLVVLELDCNPLRRLMGKLVHRTPVSDLALDELSSSAWLSVDGSRSILEIARVLGEQTGDDLDEAVRRVVSFMRYVARRGWVRFKEVKH